MDYSNIPVKNIYYLLCYAWQRLDEGESIEVDKHEFEQLVDLFAYVLIRGTRHLLKRGFDRNYVLFSEDLSCIRGKINLSTSVKRNLFSVAKANCEFDELDYNIVHNQILKSTIKLLCKVKKLDPDLKDSLYGLLRIMPEIQDLDLSRDLFNKIKINKNNQFYDFLMRVCRIVYDNVSIIDTQGSSRFQDFLRNKKQMNILFEAFVRNFYARHSDFIVGSETLEWLGSAADEESMAYLPIMRTDISLESSVRKIIIDTKFYESTLAEGRYKTHLHSANLYQLFAYLQNPKTSDTISPREGILLYPTVDKELNLEYKLSGHRVAIKTINLNQNWHRIHDRLLDILEPPLQDYIPKTDPIYLHV